MTSQAIGKMKWARLLELPISVQWAFVKAKQHRRCDRTLGMPYPPTVTCLLRIRDVPMAGPEPSVRLVRFQPDHFSDHQQLRTFARAESTGALPHAATRAHLPEDLGYAPPTSSRYEVGWAGASGIDIHVGTGFLPSTHLMPSNYSEALIVRVRQRCSHAFSS